MSGFFSSFLSDVEHFFTDDVLPVAEAGFKALASAIINNGGEVLVTTAQTAVAQTIQAGGSLTDAINTAKTNLAAQGGVVVEEAVVGAVAAAFAQAKAELSANAGPGVS